MHEDDPLRRSLAELTARIQDEVAGRIAALTEEIGRAEQRGIEQGGRNARAASTESPDGPEQILVSISRLDAASSLTSLLQALVEIAAEGQGRAAIFVLRDHELEVWQSSGFDPRPTAAIPIDNDDAVARAVRENAVIGVPDGLPPDFAALPENCRGVAIPIALAGEVVASLYVERPIGSDEERKAWQTRLQIVSQHAARGLESITALRAARFAASQTGWPFPATSATLSPVADHAAADTEAERSAHRYARLLVSEIKLYHSDAIEAGRHHRDLMTRIGGEIARAQALYEERVPERIRSGTNFFHAEVVKTLAGGDEALVSR